MSIFFAGYTDMWQRILSMAGRMPAVDAIAGVPVSGLAPAGMLSAATGVPCVALDAVPDEVRRLLVIEDASGYARFRQERIGQAPGRVVLYAAVYACGAATDLDLVGCVAEKPRVFSWNLTKSDNARRIAYDLDGVLCRDPLPGEIDYGPRYSQFITAADPLRCAPSQLGWIVTGRTERYRAATERWLADHHIRYGALVMAPDDMPRTHAARVDHKAEWCKAHPECILFVESDPDLARAISRTVTRPVVCASTEQAWHTREATPVVAASAKRHDRIIYTISTGAYEAYVPKGVQRFDGWDYRVITSRDCPPYLSAKQQAAWAKINGPRLFAEYEGSLCIDDDMVVEGDPWPMLSAHEMTSMRWESNATWQSDLALVVSERRAATADAVDADIHMLTASGFHDSPNYMTGILWRRHTAKMRELCDEWWYWYGRCQTQRDQPALAVACQRLGYAPATFTQDELASCIRHDSRRADRNGVRARVDAVATAVEKTRRKGDRL